MKTTTAPPTNEDESHEKCSKKVHYLTKLKYVRIIKAPVFPQAITKIEIFSHRCVYYAIHLTSHCGCTFEMQIKNFPKLGPQNEFVFCFCLNEKR